MIHCPWPPRPHPLPGRGGGGGVPVSKSAPGASYGFTLQSCGILIHSKSRLVLNAFSKDLGTVPGTGGTIQKNSP